MLDRRLVDLIEQIEFITKEGVHVKGAAAVSCYTYAAIKDLNPSAIICGRKIVESLLSYHQA